MVVPALLQKIKKSPSMQNVLDLLYDFTLIKPTEDLLTRGVKTELQLLAVATDACGGTYALLGDAEIEKRPVVFISSEGQAGVIASSFNAFVALLITMPFWLDVLKFSGSGKLSEMEKAFALLQREVEQDMNELLEDDDNPKKYKTIQKELMAQLNLQLLNQPVAALYQSVKNGGVLSVYDKKNGKPHTSLFSPYVTADNPLWQVKKNK